jgi:DNA-binding MarR family transcriptional regulator
MLDEWLKTLQIDEICQWDLLIFLHQHRTTLLNAEDLARLMGYESGPIIAALERLESVGIVERSRLSRGARLYQLAPLNGPPGRALAELLTLSESRAERLAVVEKLRQIRSRKPIALKIASKPQGGRSKRNRERLFQSRGMEGEQWPKVI